MMKTIRNNLSLFRFLVIFSFLIISFASDATASECKSVNLYDDLTSPLWKIPIPDQGPTSLCYAYTAATMSEYYLRKYANPKFEKSISAYWVAFNHKHRNKFPRNLIQWKKGSLGESYLRWAINDLDKNGVCDDQLVLDSIHKLKGELGITNDQFIELLEQAWHRDFHFSEIFTKKADPELKWFFESLEKCTTNQPEIELTKVEKILDTIKNLQRSSVENLSRTIFKQCAGKNVESIHLPGVVSIGLGFASNERLDKRVNEVLTSTSPQPVGIGYCSNIYKNVDFAGLRKYTILPRAIDVVKSGCTPHYSTIVGQRPVSGAQNKCEYLIRNSYGTNFWTSKWNCQCEKDHVLFDCKATSSTDLKAPAGARVIGCWANQDVLIENTFDIEHFKLKNK